MSLTGFIYNAFSYLFRVSLLVFLLLLSPLLLTPHANSLTLSFSLSLTIPHSLSLHHLLPSLPRPLLIPYLNLSLSLYLSLSLSLSLSLPVVEGMDPFLQWVTHKVTLVIQFVLLS